MSFPVPHPLVLRSSLLYQVSRGLLIRFPRPAGLFIAGLLLRWVGPWGCPRHMVPAKTPHGPPRHIDPLVYEHTAPGHPHCLRVLTLDVFESWVGVVGLCTSSPADVNTLLGFLLPHFLRCSSWASSCSPASPEVGSVAPGSTSEPESLQVSLLLPVGSSCSPGWITAASRGSSLLAIGRYSRWICDMSTWRPQPTDADVCSPSRNGSMPCASPCTACIWDRRP